MVYINFQSHNGLILTAVIHHIGTDIEGFQSHNGLILTKSSSNSCPLILNFQSHNGLILTQADEPDFVPYLLLSIPQWSDFNTYDPKKTSQPDALSIPQWSDFNMAARRLPAISLYPFNPTMV